MMKCAVFYGPEDIRIERRPVPPCPKGGMVVRVLACGICGSDVRNYHGGLKDGITEQIMGHEIAGEVVELSGDVKRFRMGGRVALAPDVSCGECWYCKRGLVNLCDAHRMLGTHYAGGFAQYIALPREVMERGFVEPVPEDMPPRHAAFAETAAAVIACQKRIGVGKGDRVLVIGDGPVGCLHVEAARARGAALVLMAGMDRLALADKFAPDALLDNRDPGAVRQAVMEMTGGTGVDFAIVAVPSVAPEPQALELLRKRGTMVIYGGVPKTDEIASLNANRIHYGELTVTGAFSYPSTGLADALEAIGLGQIHPDLYIDAVIPLDKVAEGMRMVRSGAALKVMLDPWMQ